MINGAEQEQTGEIEGHPSLPSEGEPETKSARTARLWGTALVAVGVVAMIVIAATLSFLAIAALMRSDWLTLIICVVAVILLLLLLGRLVRVAANQNKKPLG